MEAMAMGLPVLSTHHSGIPELVAHGRNGYLVAEKDIGALASAIVRAIQNPAERSAVGEAARLRVEDAFDVKVQNQRLMDLYRGLTNSVPS
jgi:colanic acid/amylovoran biosynthesis glycosyltransferase